MCHNVYTITKGDDRNMKWIIFKIKYKLGLAKEGKDFFTCGGYDFCLDCTADNPRCANRQ